MTKWIIFAFMGLFYSYSAQAMDPYDFCESFNFSNDRMECVSVVNRAYYIDNNAVQVCGAINFSRDKMNCLNIIVDHEFHPRALDICSRETHSSRVLQCLRESRRPARDTNPPRCGVSYMEIDRELERIQITLRRNDTRRADAIAGNLRSLIRRCY